MNEMKLKSLCHDKSDWILVKDNGFDLLGMATSRFPGRKVLSFIANEKYVDSILCNENIVAIVCTQELYEKYSELKDYGVVLSNDPKKTFFEIHNKLADEDFYWRKFTNNINNTALISDKAIIGEHSVMVGENTIIEAGAVVHPGTIIGNNVIIRSGSQIGTAGFQFVNTGASVYSVITAGRAVIKDNVEIQHNCCVDRGVLGGDTVLDCNVKLDNFVHIAHDDYIGKRTFITAGVKLSGRVVIGKDCWIGVNATVSNGINIGDNCKVSLGSVVTRDVPANTTVSGNFAIEHSKFIQFIKSIR